MRPYRGKTKGGKWVYGWKLPLLDGSIIIVSEASQTTESHPHYPAVSLGVYSEVVPATVGQSMGLKDSKNVEIHEGDRWLSPRGKVYIVKYGESRDYEYGEVVGNIHE